MEPGTEAATLAAIINHVFLPPKLPGGKDSIPLEEQLVEYVLSSLEEFKNVVERGHHAALDAVMDALNHLKTVTPSCGIINAAGLESLLSTNNVVIPVFVAAQNAAIIIRTGIPDTIFEAFELSPRNEAAMSTKGRLLRKFPGSCVAIPSSALREMDFSAALSDALAKMSFQSVPEMTPQARKAGQKVDESRDTTNPTVVTGLLIEFLLAHGKHAESVGITKNTREEVILSSGHELPWRRSPVWLLIRVLLQLTLNRLSSEDLEPDFVYKRFMIFFMAQIQRRSLQLELPTVTLIAINAKIVQRQLKMRQSVGETWISPVLKIIGEATKTVEQRSSQIIAANRRPLNTSSLLHPEIDTDLRISLPQLEEFIQSIPERTVNKPRTCFKPTSSFQDITTNTAALPQIWSQSANNSDQVHNLIAVEDWIDLNLDTWVADQKQNIQRCSMLYELVLEYHKLAKSLYLNQPESTSKMLLTILELWIACDKSVIESFPLVAQYDPGIPMGFWQMLLLRSKRDLERLHRAEEYLTRGRWSCGFRSPILGSFGSPSSFAVRFFNGSPHHQSLKARIEEYATIQREAKVAELEELKSKHRNLVAQAATMSCKYTDDKFGRPQHAKRCGKCKVNSQARDMTIEVHEWPLPASETHAQAAVFETSLPADFSAWRDCTLVLITDILGYQHFPDSPPSPAFHPCNYEGLYNFFQSPGYNHRVSLVSQVKPHRNTHRKNVEVASATERAVCLPNGLIWELYDGGADRIITTMKQHSEMYDRCIFRLSDNMSNLQKYLRRTPDRLNDPTPNTVIATQMECPYDMTLAMYKDLCTMPLGYHIQWMSILTQLAMPSIDWNRPETLLFIWQIVEQTGPRAEDWPRVSHATIQEERFVIELLKHLELSLARVRKNWESSKAVAVFSTIAVQVLSVGHPNCAKACLSFLNSCQSVCLEWMRALKDTIQSTSDEDQRAAFMDKCHEVALICASCFDIGHPNLDCLPRGPIALAEFLECSMTIEEMQRPFVPTDMICKSLKQRWQRCIHRFGHRLMRSSVTSKDAQALDIAVSSKWEPFSRQCHQLWEVVSTCWVGTLAKTATGADTIPVHFNLLTAQLLVNGLPLSRFPSQYETHSSYRTLFKGLVLSCSPSTSPGMELQAGRRFDGNELHFGLKLNPSGRGESDMLLSVMATDSVVELVPPRLLKSSLPHSFVNDYIHFYNAATDSVHFRLKSKPWDSSQTGWTLRRSEEYWYLRCSDSVTLVNPSSAVAQRCNEIFKTLEHLMGLHIVFSPSLQRLSIRIPRLNLDFWTGPNSDFISSTQYPRMHIDTRQDFDTLIGLKNKLVLCQDEDPSVRTVLIPEGEVTVEKFRPGLPQEHPILTINVGTKVQAYQINCHLRVLEGNGSLQSKLFLAYLHALSSRPVPDPFTQHTGTEQSLSILRSGGVRSFDVLTAENIAILARIAELTPARNYYPLHLQQMQRITWSESLCPFSQHGDFVVVVQELLNQAGETAFLYPHIKQELPSLQLPNANLAERDSKRCATFRIQGFGAEAFSTLFDEPYKSRDVPQCDRLTRVLETCRALLNSQIPSLNSVPDGYDTQFCDLLWSFLELPSGTTGPSYAMSHSQVSYDKEWLEDHDSTLPDIWCRMHALIQHGIVNSNPVQVRLWISSLAFSKRINRPILQALVGIVINAQMRNVEIPKKVVFYLQCGAAFDRHSLENEIRQAKHPFERCPEARSATRYNETAYGAADRRKREWEENLSRTISETLDHFHNQWLSQETVLWEPPKSINTYIDRARACVSTRAKFEKWRDNIAFKQYLQNLTFGMESIDKATNCSRGLCRLIFPQRASCLSRVVNVVDIFRSLKPPAIMEQAPMKELIAFTTPSTVGSQCLLQSFLGELKVAGKSRMEARYMENLAHSASSLHEQPPQYKLTGSQATLHARIIRQALEAKSQFDSTLQTLKQLLAMPSPACQQATEAQETTRLHFAAATHQWPRWSPRTLLQQLNQRHRSSLPDVWLRYLIHFAKRLEALQWAQRLVALKHQDADLLKELRNHGSNVWDREEYTDSLLIEVEANLRIRSIQGEIAHTMRDPPNGANTSVQLNMGEGKSSLIVPAVAVSLADGTRLVRVVVAKPQSKQMLEMLVSKIGGLLDRRIFLLPFSRTTQINSTQAQIIHRQCVECMLSGGILLVQPEHLLSLQLMTVESFYRGDVVLGKQLLQTKKLFMEKARDIVDESDENFSPKFELIYTIGQQQSIEHAPQRWVIIHEILAYVAMMAGEVKEQNPSSLEVGPGEKGTFPRIRILDENGQEALVNTLATHICQYGLASFPVARQPQETRNMIFQYMTHCSLTKSQIDAVELSAFWTSTTRDTLLLLRGLFAKGILAFAFGNKRWRVNYGLDPNRLPKTMLAVPYRAKDSPSARSEFSHPDVVIILTSLSYYYGGLSDTELFTTMYHLRTSDHAVEEYQVWMSSTCSMPFAFRQLEGVNLRDETQCKNEVFPHLKQLKNTIDYFLSHIVFTKEIKEFPHKLSASGWDIGAVKEQPVTAFSGTNDSQHLLPLDVEQLDLCSQRHTNALVLGNLLQPCNSVTLMPELSSQLSGHGMATLRRISEMEPPTRVILDVGAQIIDLNNQEVAAAWLEINAKRPDIGAVVFCDENDDVCVLDRSGRVERLLISAFSKKLDACLVFLDEAHTRGIDLRLPQNYRAAVTLGANLTKDRLVQACMRMRKLGAGQTLVFCVPSEVERKIRALMAQPQTPINITHILRWVISETLTDLKRSMPIWANQGQCFNRQDELWKQATQWEMMDQSLADKFLEDDAPSLEKRYRPSVTTSLVVVSQNKADDTRGSRIAQRCDDFEVHDFESAALQEEQERELEPEAEQERQVERPPPAQPAQHVVHKHVRRFVETGVISTADNAFLPAFKSLAQTTAAERFNIAQFPADLWVTGDFAHTVQRSGLGRTRLDAFQRDVRWVLTTQGGGSGSKAVDMVVISPFEANQLLPSIKASSVVRLHIYAPRQNRGHAPIDHLSLYTLPSASGLGVLPCRRIVELNLFAGQLYFDSFAEYTRVCDFLNLSWSATVGAKQVRPDGFIIVSPGSSSRSRFQESPVPFLQALMGKIRRQCDGIAKTHMGRLLEGTLLSKSDIEEEDGRLSKTEFTM